MLNHIMCLLLDKRYNERERISEQFKKEGLNVFFFLAGNGKLRPPKEYDHIDIVPPSGRWGYPAFVNRPNSYNAFLCFKKIIQLAKDLRLPEITICEDDVVLLPNFREVWDLAYAQLAKLPSWDMLYLCSNHTWTPTTLLSPNVLKLNGSGGFQMVGIAETIYDAILELPIIGPIDERVGRIIHPKYNCYAVWPNIAIPKPGFSECEGYSYDNTHLYKNRGC